MSKFNTKRGRYPATPRPTAVPATTNHRVATHEGGIGYEPDLESELVITAASFLVGEDTIYESASARDIRFVDLVHRATAADPEFVARFAPYLRNELKIRSASVMLAAEYVAAGGPEGRAVVNSVLARPDEPGEMIGYWFGRYGRNLKMAIKRGVADAATRLYTEKAALRYDGAGRAVRMADVIELTHPKPANAYQSALFTWLLDNRHHDDGVADPTLLPTLAAAAELAAVPVEQRDAVLAERGARVLSSAGMSWEQLSSWRAGGMDARAWEAAIPSMKPMALIRNLRNFDEAGVGRGAAKTVTKRITDKREVERARLFPYHVWSAYRQAPSDRWKVALGQTLAHTTANIPSLDRTLVVIDMSGSMQAPVARRSKVTRVEVAAVMAAVTAHRAAQVGTGTVDVVIYGQGNRRVSLRLGGSVLGHVRDLVSLIGSVGHATFGHTAIGAHFDAARHDRVIMFTDDQQHDAGSIDLSAVPLIYTVDLAGHRPRSLPSGGRGRYTLAGFSDATFSLIEVVEAGRRGDWPF